MILVHLRVSGGDNTGMSVAKLYPHMMSEVALLPPAVVRTTASFIGVPSDVTQTGAFVTPAIHPLVKRLWESTLLSIKTSSLFWRTDTIVYAATAWMAAVFVSDKNVPRVIQYADVWTELEKTVGALPRMAATRAKMLARFKADVADRKISALMSISSTAFRRKTALGCFSVSQLSNCLMRAGCRGIEIEKLIHEDANILEFIAELERDGCVYRGNRRVYATSILQAIPSELASHFHSTHVHSK